MKKVLNPVNQRNNQQIYQLNYVLYNTHVNDIDVPFINTCISYYNN